MASTVYRTVKLLPLLFGLVCAPVVLAAQAAPATRTATCLEGLKAYGSPASVPVPHDTVMPDLSNLGNTVNGMRQITDRDEFFKGILRAAAAIGATGYINYRGGETSETGNAQSLGRVLPVFVAADSARALGVCRAKATTPKPPG